MAILICSATSQELSALAPGLFPQADRIPEMQPIAGKLNNLNAIFIVTGSGPVNASLAVGYSLGITHEKANDKITAILCVGLANAFNLEKCPLCSIWHVKREIWPEYGLNDGIRVTAKAFTTPLWKRAENESVYDVIDLDSLTSLPVPENSKAFEWPECSSITVAGVTASFARRDSLYNFYHADLENMEGFAIAYAAMRASVPCVEIRVIAAKAGPRSKEEKNHEGAIKTLSTILPVMKLI